MNLHRFDLVTLSLFALVARSGSVSKGAALAHLTTGAASKRLSELERSFGAQLLDRHSRGVTLTAAGQVLHQHAQRILADLDQLCADLSEYAEGVTGVVRLWANTSAVTEFLPTDISSFVSDNSGIRIELDEQNSRDIVYAVLDGRADIGIFADRTPLLGLQAAEYRADRLVLIVPRQHELAAFASVPLPQASEFDFVGLAAPTSLAERLKLEAEALGRRLRLRVQVRSFDAVCQMVAAGLGIAVLPEAAIAPHLRSMAIRQVELDEPWIHRKLLLGARDFSALSRPARALAMHLLGPGRQLP